MDPVFHLTYGESRLTLFSKTPKALESTSESRVQEAGLLSKLFTEEHLLTTAEAIEEHRAYRPDSAKVGAFVAVVEGRPFLRECIRCSMQSALSIPVVMYSTLSELGNQAPEHASAQLVVLSLIEASSQACANALKRPVRVCFRAAGYVLSPPPMM